MDNVESAKIYFGVVLNRLSREFPAAVHLNPEEIWEDFEKLVKGSEIRLRGRTRYTSATLSVEDASSNKKAKIHYCKLMSRWMVAEGFLHPDPASNFPYDYVLSSKALAVLDLTFEDDSQTVREKLASAISGIGETVQSETIANQVERVFETLQGVAQ